MNDKELKKLSRKELLEVLVLQSQQIERLTEELEQWRKKAELRSICIENSGSIAEAALRLNRVFEDADAAAKQYVESIKIMFQIEHDALKRIAEKENALQDELDKRGKTQHDISACERDINYAG